MRAAKVGTGLCVEAVVCDWLKLGVVWGGAGEGVKKRGRRR